MSKLPLEMNLSVPCTAEFVGVIRLAISGVASRMNFTVEDIEDIKVSISEACTNAIQHAYTNGQDTEKQKIAINTLIYPEKLEIRIEDFGEGFDTSILNNKNLHEKSKEKFGLGLGITFIKSLMDDSKVESKIGKGTTVTMMKRLTSAN